MPNVRMLSQKIRVSALNIYTFIVHARKNKHKQGEPGKSLYMTLPVETARALDVRESDVLTVAIIKKERPVRSVQSKLS